MTYNIALKIARAIYLNMIHSLRQLRNRNADRSPVSAEEQSALISLITILFFSIIIEVRIAFSD